MIVKKLLFPIILSFVIFFTLTSQADASTRIKILLVPGHDNEVWGSQYSNRKEADMNLAVATKIYNLLKKDKRFDVYITRDSKGYTKEFADYFANHQADVFAFKENAKKVTQNEIATGSLIKKTNPPHHGVTEDVAIRLYGFNKWADENKIDAVVHIHFNDYPRSNKWEIGKYKGFVIYVPEGQMVNSKKSTQLAAKIFTQLRKKYSTSTFKPELGGLVPDQSLIALGSNGTLDASVRSVLVEYGYIYEKKFRVKNTRNQAYKDMTNLTTTGIKNYFFPSIKK